MPVGDDETSVNVVGFYNPYMGYGALMALPHEIKLLAESFACSVSPPTLVEAVDAIRRLAIQLVDKGKFASQEVIARDGMILLKFHSGGGRIDTWRVIQYHEAVK